MAETTDPLAKQASREATDWLILLQDDPDDADLARRFVAWRDSPINAAAWEATQSTVRSVAAATPALAGHWRPFLDAARRAEGMAAPRPARMRNAAVGRRSALGLGAAAALAASFAAILIGPGLMLDLRADHVSGTAEVRSVRLTDDSVVTLAPESAIAVGYAAGERRVELLAGEAFFEVAPDPAQPFRVSVGPVDVVVLGTGFDVRREPGGTEVGVEHGVVRVDHAGALPPVAQRLTAGRSLRVSWSGQTENRESPAGQVAVWRHRQLIAQDQPLGAVVDRLRRYHAARIVVTDAALAARPVTGVYNLADPVDALRAIARAQKAVVRRVTPWLLLVSPS